MNLFSVKQQSEIESSILESGYAIIENAIDNKQLNQLNKELESHFRVAHDGHDDFMGHKTVRFGALLEKSKVVQDLILHDSVLKAADKILLNHCANYHIHYTGVMRILPGENAQVLHRDTGIFPIANPSPPFTLATMWALDDFTLEKGGTVLVPGSHLWDDFRQPKKDELVFTEMSAGSVLIYTGNVIHGGGANISNTFRTGLAIHYGLGWLRQEENQFLSCSQETARTLPDRLQELLGYQLASPSFGFADHIHPKDYLHGVRNPGESDVSNEALFKRHESLNRLAMTEITPPSTRFYKAED